MQTNFFSGTSKALRMPNFCASGHDCAVPTEIPGDKPWNHHNTKTLGAQPHGDLFKRAGAKG